MQICDYFNLLKVSLLFLCRPKGVSLQFLRAIMAVSAHRTSGGLFVRAVDFGLALLAVDLGQ
jgi:hypothetical protein